jgi:NAD+ kinase
LEIALYARSIRDEDLPFIRRLLEQLWQKNITISAYENLIKQLPGELITEYNITSFSSHKDIAGKADFMFSLGGDGTLLDTLIYVRNYDIPVMGINLGRLGFLATISKDEVNDAIDAIVAGSYVSDKRTLIQLESNLDLFGNVNYALNEFTIHKREDASMIIVRTYINGEFLTSYWADGLIVASPTGSTGYSLSCGGPIVIPSASNFVITPIAPHNLNVRSVVVPDDSIISFEIEGRTGSFLCTLDARFSKVDSLIQLAVKKCPFQLTLIRLSDTNFLNTLATKLMWGADKRN